MAIPINTVYQTVQRLLNIEQRGQLPPADFNHFANLAQLDLFNMTMSDLAHFKLNPKGGDRMLSSNLMEQVEIFTDYFESTKAAEAPTGRLNSWSLPNNLHTLEHVYYTNAMGLRRVVERIDHDSSRYVLNSTLTQASTTFPKFERYYNAGDGIGNITILPDNIASDVLVEYIRKPSVPNWAGTSVQGTDLFNASNSTDFELHNSIQDDLIMKILLYAGVSTRQDDITAFAAGVMQAEEASEKS